MKEIKDNLKQEPKQYDFNVKKLISTPYKYGFTTDIENEEFPRGLNEEVIRLISEKKNEPSYMLDFRIRAYSQWSKMISPEWASIKHIKIDYQDIIYYSAPKTKKKINSLDEVDIDILDTYEKLGIPLTVQK
jgi:Fe-S cluster assembly protein SufB